MTIRDGQPSETDLDQVAPELTPEEIDRLRAEMAGSSDSAGYNTWKASSPSRLSSDPVDPQVGSEDMHPPEGDVDRDRFAYEVDLTLIDAEVAAAIDNLYDKYSRDGFVPTNMQRAEAIDVAGATAGRRATESSKFIEARLRAQVNDRARERAAQRWDSHVEHDARHQGRR